MAYLATCLSLTVDRFVGCDKYWHSFRRKHYVCFVLKDESTETFIRGSFDSHRVVSWFRRVQHLQNNYYLEKSLVKVIISLLVKSYLHLNQSCRWFVKSCEKTGKFFACSANWTSHIDPVLIQPIHGYWHLNDHARIHTGRSNNKIFSRIQKHEKNTNGNVFVRTTGLNTTYGGGSSLYPSFPKFWVRHSGKINMREMLNNTTHVTR